MIVSVLVFDQYFCQYCSKSLIRFFILRNVFTDCPEPVPLAVVVGAIVGSIVTLGLIILALLKGIIMFIQWREYKKFVENMASQQWGQVSIDFCILGRNRHYLIVDFLSILVFTFSKIYSFL